LRYIAEVTVEMRDHSYNVRWVTPTLAKSQSLFI
jgi:hypothetical protein